MMRVDEGVSGAVDDEGGGADEDVNGGWCCG